MRRLSIFIIFLTLNLGSIGSVLADPLDGYMQASQQFDEWMEKYSAMPRLSDERAATFLAPLSDSRRFLDGNTFGEAQLPVLMDLCGQANRKAKNYLLFDLDKVVEESMPLDAAQQAIFGKMLRNSLTYQDELALLQPFEIRCMAKLVPLVTRMFEHMKPEEITPVRRQGIEMMRKGMDSFFLATLSSASDPSLNDRYRTNMLMAAAETAPQIVPAMKPEEREKLKLAAKTVVNTAPENLKDYIERIADTFAQPNCEGLCRY
ncbi:hypothetical protein [Pandoraea sputorum]|uniref:hypothetical protein n=1 Tax=Pandoraea sputorum TaxID=93222 RepID=UPI0012414252|nr:hypothetical protein [Pandoraea sputorum]VVE79134.1 hypothetical protein PSP31120_02043 [Pandoraea sputorum]